MCSETDFTQEIVWRHHHLVSGIFETQTLCVIHQPARQVPMSPNLTDWLPFLDKSWSEDRKHLLKLCQFHCLFYTYFKCPVASHFIISATVQVLQQYYLGGWERRKFHLRTPRYFKSFALYSLYSYVLFILLRKYLNILKVSWDSFYLFLNWGLKGISSWNIIDEFYGCYPAFMDLNVYQNFLFSLEMSFVPFCTPQNRD